MIKYRLINKYLLIDKPVKDVTHAISNSFDAFASDISHKLTLDGELFVLKLTHQAKFKILDSYVTIAIESTNQNNTQTELELLFCYKSDESTFNAWFQKVKIQWKLNNFLLEFKKKCEKWL